MTPITTYKPAMRLGSHRTTTKRGQPECKSDWPNAPTDDCEDTVARRPIAPQVRP
jgi:hypothetical protein